MPGHSTLLSNHHIGKSTGEASAQPRQATEKIDETKKEHGQERLFISIACIALAN
jgi:hypothetical protein